MSTTGYRLRKKNIVPVIPLRSGTVRFEWPSFLIYPKVLVAPSTSTPFHSFHVLLTAFRCWSRLVMVGGIKIVRSSSVVSSLRSSPPTPHSRRPSPPLPSSPEKIFELNENPAFLSVQKFFSIATEDNKLIFIVRVRAILDIVRFFIKGEFVMLKRIGFVDRIKVWSFVRNYENLLEAERWNGKKNTSGRKCLWFGLGVELGFKSTVFEGFEIDNSLRKRCDALWCGSDWNSILLYKYQQGCELKAHVDRDIFDSKVILINISEDDLLGGNVEFFYNENIEILSNGEIIEFNSKIPHGIKKLKSERWSLSIRKIITA
jgi:hypothetical protein